ncbi:MAG: GyrI-like domain-containing protein [Pricia sp.]
MDNLNLAPFNIIGIAIRTTNENNQAATDIPALWDHFIKENILEKIPNKVDNTVYALYTDYESDHTRPYTTILGCKTENLNVVPDGMMGRTFEGGDYIKFTTRGNLAKGLIIREWQKIWETDLDRRYTLDFEVYGEKARNPSDAEVDIMIAVA